MLAELTEKTIQTIRDAARRLTGAARREFEAGVAIDYCQGSPRRAETVFGWGRATVQAGLDQWQTGVGRQDQFFPRGRRKTEEKIPDLEKHIRRLVEPDCQVDPKFQSPFLYTRMTAKAVGRALVEKAGYRATELPTERTCRRLLNRLGLRLRRVQKTKPHKKIKETDAIFANVRHAHDRAAWDEGCLRISMDGKAKVKVGEFSRGGKSRGTEARKACDHDMNAEAILAPFGILEVDCGQLFVVFGTSRETSDFIVDCLQLWWDERKSVYPHIRRLQIDLDNGPEQASNRTQFIKRLVEFADNNGLVIELVYYPPYHSKYNSIERCWGVLEQHWNGAILNSLEAVLAWAQTMTWKGIPPIVRLLENVYSKGVRLCRQAIQPYADRLRRLPSLLKWSVEIFPLIAPPV
jgi:transposase